MKNTRKGFTLVELLVVIAILAILATVSVVGYTSFINRANDSVAQQELTQIRDYYIASKYIKEVAVDDNLVRELGLQGNILRGKVGEDVIYKYTVKTGVAYWNTTTNSISSTKLDAWEEVLCDHAHKETIEGKDPTCTETGLTEGLKCTDCGTVLTSQTEIPAPGHLDENGDKVCDRNCGHTHNFVGANCQIEGACECGAKGAKAPSVHANVVTDEAVPATCVATGKTEGSHCGACGVTIEAQTDTDMIPHSAGSNGKCSCGASLVYLVVGPWNVSGKTERYTVYYFKSETDNGWADMKETGEAGVYEAYIPNGYTKISFCRMDGSIAENGWTNNNPFWNQTEDLTVTAGGRFTIVDPWGNEANQKKATGTWGTVLYLKPNSNWTQGNARFAAYFFNDSKTKTVWESMTDYNGDGTFEVIVPEGCTNIIFCRMNPKFSDNNWNPNNYTDETKRVWDQTADLTVPTNGKNLYTVPTGAWGGSNNDHWSTK